RGYQNVGDTKILRPGRPKKSDSPYQRRIARERFRRRAGIEPIIGHLKQDHRLSRNYLKGVLGDAINLFMAAAAFNFRKWIRKFEHFFALFTLWLFFGTTTRQPSMMIL
ncbi:Transposase DDE domain-containing protein, partial [Desulfonatronum thiosulfatophilum]